jgi:glycosyltransferase involved in cell wall biosynthesis
MTDVSVVIAARNEERWAGEAVASILAQKGLEFELIFIDDNSTDKTFEIVEALGKGNLRLRLLRNTKSGKVSAFNYGVSVARGDWLCLFAGDDVMPEGSLAERWHAVTGAGDEGLVTGLCRIKQISEFKSQDGIIVPKNPAKGAFSGQSYLMNRAAIAKTFPVPEQFPNEDTWMEIAVTSLPFRIIHTPVIGCYWRVHENNSINYLADFATFNKRIGVRMAAYRVFLDMRGQELTPQAREQLNARAKCEEARTRRSITGILFSGATPRDKLRALLLVNPFMYWIRSKFYWLISGR